MSIQDTAITGLKAAAFDLQVTGNNVANAGTYGFKSSRTEFSDLFYAGSENLQVGNGVQIASVSQDFSSNGFSVTGGKYDMAVNSDGFFVLKSPSEGGTSYTRTGNFTTDKDGYLVSQGGARVQGYLATNGVISSSMGDIELPTGDVAAPKASKDIAYEMNLDSSSSVLGAPFSATDSTTYNNRTSVSIFDSLGASHIMNSYYVKTADNAWDVNVEVDNSIIGTGSVNFNTDGTFASQASLTGMTFNPGGGAAAAQPLDLSLSKMTQFGSETVVHKLDVDGYTSGMPGNINIDDDGVITATYSNGTIEKLAQVAIAKFESPQGLYSDGRSTWSETNASGSALISQSNSINGVKAGALENSNVDLTDQLVKLITAQRSFQANAQSARAGDVIAQTIINLE